MCYWSNEANYWQTGSIVRPLCDSRATCPVMLFINKRCYKNEITKLETRKRNQSNTTISNAPRQPQCCGEKPWRPLASRRIFYHAVQGKWKSDPRSTSGFGSTPKCNTWSPQVHSCHVWSTSVDAFVSCLARGQTEGPSQWVTDKQHRSVA